ncbi:RNA transcription, translation and transport factor protein [Oratosquilla oratoria]|uniref:RNA transcription, translation and transport factor protein n=1 Tax=Oratosquilla oratoria TaxID=337810 RepID=UPI003F75C0BF
MYRRKLTALGYVQPEGINLNDDKSFKNLIVWLENQKIRSYKIEDRGPINDVDSRDWETNFIKYCGQLNCPIDPKDRPAVVDWLLGLAVHFEYQDNAEKFKQETSENVLNRRSSAPKVVNTNPLDALDFQSPDFIEGVNKLAGLLNINPHPDHLVTLQAISKMVKSRLNNEALQNPGEFVHQGKPYPIFESDLGFETGDFILNNAGKALRLLHIHDLRELQTQINECIVAVQLLTANPKTDTKLGKVGR